jgi:TonB family protein
MNIPPGKVVVMAASLLLAVSGAPDGRCDPPAKPVSKAAVSPKAANTAGTKPGPFSAAYTAYINRLRAKLENKWYLADGRNKVTLSVTVSNDGSVTDLELTSTPRNTQAEQAASDAFNQCQPLETLPAGSSPVKLALVFESFADPHGDNNRNLTGTVTPIATKPAVGTDSGNGGNNSGNSGSSGGSGTPASKP